MKRRSLAAHSLSAAAIAYYIALSFFPLLLVLVAGLGFKLSLVPFHLWTPDVYQGAPTNITAFMAAATKAAGFAMMLRLYLVAFPSLSLMLPRLMG